MNSIVPSVGRVVHFWQTSFTGKKRGPLAALITGVHGDACDLAVFPAGQDQRNYQAVAMGPPANVETESYHWSWPARV